MCVPVHKCFQLYDYLHPRCFSYSSFFPSSPSPIQRWLVSNEGDINLFPPIPCITFPPGSTFPGSLSGIVCNVLNSRVGSSTPGYLALPLQYFDISFFNIIQFHSLGWGRAMLHILGAGKRWTAFISPIWLLGLSLARDKGSEGTKVSQTPCAEEAERREGFPGSLLPLTSMRQCCTSKNLDLGISIPISETGEGLLAQGKLICNSQPSLPAPWNRPLQHFLLEQDMLL